MIVHVNTFGLIGIKGFYVNAEVNLTKGLPYFDIIGMGNKAVKESADRIKPALENSGFVFPLGRITVNLAPASIKKEGSYFDLAIAIGVLKCTGIVTESIKDISFIGELSLDGHIRPVKGILPMIQASLSHGITKCVVPLENAYEAALVEKCEIFPSATINEVINIINHHGKPWKRFDLLNYNEDSYSDFSDIKGQSEAVRAAEISAAGGHNILFLGAAGCGKTMIASRIPGIMPDLTDDEAMEVTPVYSVLGLLNNNSRLIKKVPFRTVYPDVSKAGLIGGGSHPVPGEISLAHKGILFLDEFAEFNRNTIQSLRQPIENKRVLISRCGDFVEFPSDFLLIAASNPCKCGKLLEGSDHCSCSTLQAKQYLSKISKPILDRIDLHVPVRQVSFYDLDSCDSTYKIKCRVIEARERQKHRYKNSNFNINGRISNNEIKEYCKISNECERLLKDVAQKNLISMRAFNKCIKIARTIADLDGRDNIQQSDIAESLQYRFLDTFSPDAV